MCAIVRGGVGAGGKQVVAAPVPGRELVLGDHQAGHPHAVPRHLGQLSWAGRPVLRFDLADLGRGGLEDLDHRADPHPAVISERGGGECLARVGLIGHPPGNELDRPGQVGRGELERIERPAGVDGVAGGAADRGDPRDLDWCDLGDLRHLGQLGQRPGGIDDAVVAVPAQEIRERDRGRPGSGRGRHHQPADQGRQHGQGQPRLPVLAQLGAQHHANGAHDHPFPVRQPGRAPQ